MEKIRDKCACPTCQCRVEPGKGILRNDRVYCCQACASDCTETTCVCVHDRCEEHPAEPK